MHLAFHFEAGGHSQISSCQSDSFFCILWCHPDEKSLDSPVWSLPPHWVACSLLCWKVPFHVQDKCWSFLATCWQACVRSVLAPIGWPSPLTSHSVDKGNRPFQNGGIDLSHNCLLVNSIRLELDIWFWSTHPQELVGPHILEYCHKDSIESKWKRIWRVNTNVDHDFPW